MPALACSCPSILTLEAMYARWTTKRWRQLRAPCYVTMKTATSGRVRTSSACRLPPMCSRSAVPRKVCNTGRPNRAVPLPPQPLSTLRPTRTFLFSALQCGWDTGGRRWRTPHAHSPHLRSARSSYGQSSPSLLRASGQLQPSDTNNKQQRPKRSTASVGPSRLVEDGGWASMAASQWSSALAPLEATVEPEHDPDDQGRTVSPAFTPCWATRHP